MNNQGPPPPAPVAPGPPPYGIRFHADDDDNMMLSFFGSAHANHVTYVDIPVHSLEFVEAFPMEPVPGEIQGNVIPEGSRSYMLNGSLLHIIRKTPVHSAILYNTQVCNVIHEFGLHGVDQYDEVVALFEENTTLPQQGEGQGEDQVGGRRKHRARRHRTRHRRTRHHRRGKRHTRRRN